MKNILPESTEKLWRFSQAEGLLPGALLIGGTALALQIQHRMSLDLDVIWLDPKLPRFVISQYLKSLRENGFEVLSNDDPELIIEAINCSVELHDFRQDYLINGTKITFFSPDEPDRRLFQANLSNKIQVASLQEIFDSKAYVISKRTKSRDWIDLYFLIHDHGFSIIDFYNAYQKAGDKMAWNTGMARLISATPLANDEGYLSLLENPPTLSEIGCFFKEQRDLLEDYLLNRSN